MLSHGHVRRGVQVVYIAPLKALVRERIDDWGQGLCRVLNKRMVELTGEVTPDIKVRPPPPHAVPPAVLPVYHEHPRRCSPGLALAGAAGRGPHRLHA